MSRTRIKTSHLLLFIWILLTGTFIVPYATALAQSDPASEVIQLVNWLRVSYGLPAYEVDSVLMSVAQAQASWSAANNHIGHDGPGGSSPNDRAQAADYGASFDSFAIENTAHGTANINTPQLVVTMWQGDWGHLNAMISPDYEHIGVGYAEADGNSWYVMMVGWVADGSGPAENPNQEAPEAYTPLAPFVVSEPDETGAIYHEVQPGQSAWTIAAYYGVELADLLAINHLTEDSIIHPGDNLLIRPPEAQSVSPTLQRLPELPTEIPTSTQAPPPPTDVTFLSSSPLSQSIDISPTLPPGAMTTTSPRSTTFFTILTAGLGMAVLVSIIIVSRMRKQ